MELNPEIRVSFQKFRQYGRQESKRQIRFGCYAQHAGRGIAQTRNSLPRRINVFNDLPRVGQVDLASFCQLLPACCSLQQAGIQVFFKP